MRRSAYTLMEVILALAIAVLLLGALYVAVDLQLRSAQSGRESVEQSTLVRSLFAHLDADASSVIALPDAARFRNPQNLNAAGTASGGTGSGGGATGTPASGSGGGGTGAGGTGAGGAGSGSSSSNSAANLSSSGNVATYTNQNGVQVILLPYGVIGDSQTLHMFISRVPREIINAQLKQQQGNVSVVGDLRRVSYWLLDGDGGLAKQEAKIALSDDSGAIDQGVLPPNVSDPSTYSVLAPEVKTLQFEYYDGTEWSDSWDSTTPGADGVTPVGSPVAIRITIGLAQPNKPDLKQFQHVVFFMTANGTTSMTQTGNNSTTGGGSTTSP
jgi:hypothetical protein